MGTKRKPTLGSPEGGKHHKVVVDFPPWVEQLSPDSMCLRSVAEDVYYARALAFALKADRNPRCTGLLSAAAKSMKILEDAKAGDGKRCAAGDRAARKYWEAKVCARNVVK